MALERAVGATLCSVASPLTEYRRAPMGAGRAGAIDRLLNAGQRLVVFGLASISLGGLTYIGACFVDMQRRKYAIKQSQSIEQKPEEEAPRHS